MVFGPLYSSGICYQSQPGSSKTYLSTLRYSQPTPFLLRGVLKACACTERHRWKALALRGTKKRAPNSVSKTVLAPIDPAANNAACQILGARFASKPQPLGAERFKSNDPLYCCLLCRSNAPDPSTTPCDDLDPLFSKFFVSVGLLASLATLGPTM